jgi:hypothetical protein
MFQSIVVLTESALDNLIFDVDRFGVSVSAERTGAVGDDDRITESPEDALS